jgi:DNA-binding NtrC family response regulator
VEKIPNAVVAPEFDSVVRMLMPPRNDGLESLGRILMIDDEVDVVEVVSVYFSGSGYEVIGATQAGDGLMLADIHRPDLVLLDIMMPGIDGIEALQQFHLRWPDLPVIMLTAVANLDTARGALKRGAFDYVQKPFEWEHLERVVGAALMAGSLRGR